MRRSAAQSNLKASSILPEDNDEVEGVEESWKPASDAGMDEGPGNVEEDLRSVSFGALVNAKSALGSSATAPRRTKNAGSSRDRLRETSRSSPPAEEFAHSQSASRPTREKKERKDKAKRESSKHAPMEMTSKRPVSRYRHVVDVPASKSRDPRFDAISADRGGPVDMHRVRQNYAFLDDYKEDEMRMMRDELGKEKDEPRRLQIEKKLQSLESRKLVQQRKDEEEEWLAKHKKQEREAIKQGKKPYYLKKSEAKRMMLREKFSNLGEKQRDRVLEKKRRKQASKEKKNLPWSRRTLT